jgi:hypothetical protein
VQIWSDPNIAKHVWNDGDLVDLISFLMRFRIARSKCSSVTSHRVEESLLRVAQPSIGKILQLETVPVTKC